MHQDLHVFGSVIVDPFDLDLSLFSGFNDRFNKATGGFSIRQVFDHQCFVIDLFNFRPDTDRTTP